MTIATTNPATGQTLRTFTELSGAELEHKLAAAAHAARMWSDTPIETRLTVLRRTADLLDDQRATFARLATLEMGKTLRAAGDEVAKCALACRYYADHAAEFLAPDVVDDGGSVMYQPLGVVLAVMPWNFPFWQVIRFAAPALAAGNVALLKHASNVPQCALAIEALFVEAGAPPGVFQTLLLSSARVETVIADPRVAAVTLTGSGAAGRAVARSAGQHLKKTVLELGGSDPFLVLPSAALDEAAATAVKARTINNGQSCIAAKRFIVHEEIADAFETRFVQRMRTLKVGDPTDERTDVGPLASADIRRDLDAQVRASVAQGARVLAGGAPVPGPGFYYPPTVLTDIPTHAPAFREELFGPVAALFRVPDLAAAVALANDSPFGLGASVWTADESEAERCARELHVGSVFVNGMVASDPRFPFGGVKESGYGRELGAVGLREFVNIKTVRRMTAHPSASAVSRTPESE